MAFSVHKIVGTIQLLTCQAKIIGWNKINPSFMHTDYTVHMKVATVEYKLPISDINYFVLKTSVRNRPGVAGIPGFEHTKAPTGAGF
jgi:hypothetical protein